MIKICDSMIVEPLCMIFEKWLVTGQYPSIWKIANIIPVHKKVVGNVKMSHIYVQSSIVLFVPVFCLVYRIVFLHCYLL